MPFKHSLITISKASLRIKLESIGAFAAAFLATDYLWYKQEYKYINSLLWVHVLGRKGGLETHPQQSESLGSSNDPASQQMRTR